MTVCPSPTADPSSRMRAAATQQPPTPPAICLSGFELPTRLRQGFFVPFVVALQRQADPDSDAQRPSAVIGERTIVLNATGLKLDRLVGFATGNAAERGCRIHSSTRGHLLDRAGIRRCSAEPAATVPGELHARAHQAGGAHPSSGGPDSQKSFAASVVGSRPTHSGTSTRHLGVRRCHPRQEPGPLDPCAIG